MHTDVLQPRCVNMSNYRLGGVEMKGRQVRNWIIGEGNMRISKHLYIKCVNGG